MKYDSLLEESTLRERNVRGQSLKQAQTGEDRRSVVQEPPTARLQATPVQPPASVSTELEKRAR